MVKKCPALHLFFFYLAYTQVTSRCIIQSEFSVSNLRKTAVGMVTPFKAG